MATYSNVLQKIPNRAGAYAQWVTVESAGVSFAEPIEQGFTNATETTNNTFTYNGFLSQVETVKAINQDGSENNQAGVKIVSVSGNITTLSLTYPQGLDPFTGTVYFRPTT